ncbi:uncharacterized protein LOC122032615 [Zingiber officinale]|uniref:uncharacterized protein LOC122032615 n=1 Tax=Zingiber officinale TaxID=94328 RepID=UPI001C4BD500|nr:uncharacterized protein LOC122032615 [Zingiber officinale]
MRRCVSDSVAAASPLGFHAHVAGVGDPTAMGKQRREGAGATQSCGAVHAVDSNTPPSLALRPAAFGGGTCAPLLLLLAHRTFSLLSYLYLLSLFYFLFFFDREDEANRRSWRIRRENPSIEMGRC